MLCFTKATRGFQTYSILLFDENSNAYEVPLILYWICCITGKYFKLEQDLNLYPFLIGLWEMISINQLFHVGGPYIETSPLIFIKNKWIGFFMIGTSVVKKLKTTVRNFYGLLSEKHGKGSVFSRGIFRTV